MYMYHEHYSRSGKFHEVKQFGTHYNTSGLYRILSSAHLLWFMYICIYVLYIQMVCLCKRPPPFLAHLFQAPMGAY